jgi:hypothetical protein
MVFFITTALITPNPKQQYSIDTENVIEYPKENTRIGYNQTGILSTEMVLITDRAAMNFSLRKY